MVNDQHEPIILALVHLLQMHHRILEILTDPGPGVYITTGSPRDSAHHLIKEAMKYVWLLQDYEQPIGR